MRELTVNEMALVFGGEGGGYTSSGSTGGSRAGGRSDNAGSGMGSGSRGKADRLDVHNLAARFGVNEEQVSKVIIAAYKKQHPDSPFKALADIISEKWNTADFVTGVVEALSKDTQRNLDRANRRSPNMNGGR